MHIDQMTGQPNVFGGALPETMHMHMHIDRQADPGSGPASETCGNVARLDTDSNEASANAARAALYPLASPCATHMATPMTVTAPFCAPAHALRDLRVLLAALRRRALPDRVVELLDALCAFRDRLAFAHSLLLHDAPRLGTIVDTSTGTSERLLFARGTSTCQSACALT